MTAEEIRKYGVTMQTAMLKSPTIDATQTAYAGLNFTILVEIAAQLAALNDNLDQHGIAVCREIQNRPTYAQGSYGGLIVEPRN